MHGGDDKLTPAQELQEVVRLLHKCICLHQHESRHKTAREVVEDDEEVARIRAVRDEERQLRKLERAEERLRKALLRVAETKAVVATAVAAGEGAEVAAADAAIAVQQHRDEELLGADDADADGKVPEEDEADDVPLRKKLDKMTPAFWKNENPERAPFEPRKQLARHLKAIVQSSITASASAQMIHSNALDEFFSVAYEYMCTFRDVGITILCCSFSCNLCAHLALRQLIDATALVQWFLEVGLLFNALKRVVHLCLLGVGNASMCRDLRLSDEDTKQFCSVVCRLYGEHKVVEAWACAAINLAGGRQAPNGAMLLKHGVLEMLQRLLLLHGTEDATAGRVIQALTVLSLVLFPPKNMHRDPAAAAPASAGAVRS